MNSPLLAKSTVPGRSPKTLLDHTLEVMSAAQYLFGTADEPTRLSHVWLRFFCLDKTAHCRFMANTTAAAGFHDPGKANDGFQSAVTQRGDQIIRHEHLSGLLLCLPGFKTWIAHNPLLDFEIILSAVISHHIKVSDESWGKPLDVARSFRVLAYTPDFYSVLEAIGAKLNLPIPFRPNVPYLWSFDQMDHAFCFSDLLDKAKDDVHRFEKSLRRDPERHSLLLAVKAALIAADSAGSGLVRQGKHGFIRPSVSRLNPPKCMTRLSPREFKKSRPRPARHLHHKTFSAKHLRLAPGPCYWRRAVAARLWPLGTGLPPA
jgi:CRISPR-associated endonuclease/helicase Cas3